MTKKNAPKPKANPPTFQSEKSLSETLPFMSPIKDEVWETCLFALDANVLLDLYRLSNGGRETWLSVLEFLAKDQRLFVPYQALFEFYKNRMTVVREAQKDVGSYQADIGKFQESLEGAISTMKENLKKFEENHRYQHLQDQNFLEEFEKFEATVTEFAEKKFELSTDDDVLANIKFGDDPILEKLEGIIQNAVGTEIDLSLDEHKDLKDEMFRRMDSDDIPGYEDKNKIKNKNKNSPKDEPVDYTPALGDALIWEEMKRLASSKKCSMIFISRDAKEDWIWIDSGQKQGPRYEWRREFFKVTGGHHFYMYSLKSFIHHIDRLKDILGMNDLDLSALIKESKELNAITNDASVERLKDVSLELNLESISSFLRNKVDSNQLNNLDPYNFFIKLIKGKYAKLKYKTYLVNIYSGHIIGKTFDSDSTHINQLEFDVLMPIGFGVFLSERFHDFVRGRQPYNVIAIDPSYKAYEILKKEGFLIEIRHTYGFYTLDTIIDFITSNWDDIDFYE